MLRVKDKAGHSVYVSYIDDCAENAGGYYCETYSDVWGEHKIDDFCIHPDDCDCQNPKAVEQYIRHFYDNEVLDLNWNF